MEVIRKKIVYNYCNKKYYSYLNFWQFLASNQSFTFFWHQITILHFFLQFLFFDKMVFPQKSGFLLCF